MKKKTTSLTVKEICKMTKNEMEEILTLTQHLKQSSKIFLVSQLRCSRKKPRGRRWTLEEKVMALSLYKKGPTVYRLLRCMFALPSTRTLNSILSAVTFTTGINKDIFKTLRAKVDKLEERDKMCTLVFDEMSIKENLSYDASEDQIKGIEDLGHQGRHPRIAKHALEFMACGLFKKWKQPLAFYFTSNNAVSAPVLIEMIKAMISACTNVGLHVMATICDMGSSVVQAIKALGCTISKPHFNFEGKEIITLFDPPHLIKCTRNLLQKYDIQFTCKLDGEVFTGVAKWAHIEETYHHDKVGGTFSNNNSNFSKWLMKLTDSHINPKFRRKMKVRLATQVLSHSVASSIEKDVRLGLMHPESMGTAHFAEFSDRLFDSLNGHTEKADRGKALRCRVSQSSPHHSFWKEAYECVSSWRFLKGNGKFLKPPSQDGWLITITGIQKLWENVQNFGHEYTTPVRYLVARSVNQDALENAFGSIRSHCGSNAMPNANQFVGSFKTCLINGLVYQDLKGRGNCEQDSAAILSSLQTLFSFDTPASHSCVEHEEEREEVNNENTRFDDDDSETPSEWSSTAYVSGYIARRLISKNKCKNCKASLVSNSLLNSSVWCPNFKFKEYHHNRECLTYPSESLCKSVGDSATLCEQILDKEVTRNNIMKYIVSRIEKDVNFDWLSCNCKVHSLDIKKQIATSVCKITIPWWCKKLNRALKENI